MLGIVLGVVDVILIREIYLFLELVFFFDYNLYLLLVNSLIVWRRGIDI